MNKYKYSICFPDKENIEYPDKILFADQVREIALNYPWDSELKKLRELGFDEVCYNPSLDFTNINDNYSLCLTAEGEPENYTFGVWYNRPIMKKVLFGLLGEKVKFSVIDKGFSKEDSFKLLDKFLKRDYEFIEREMNN